MMTEKKTLFLLPKLWSSFHPLVPVPVLRARVPGSWFIGKKGPLFIPYVLGTLYPKWVFLGGLGVVGPPPVLIPVPYPLSLHPSPVKSISNKKRDHFVVPSSRCWLLALSGRSFASFLYVLGSLVCFGGFLCCFLSVWFIVRTI